MKRDPRLRDLSDDHHTALVVALRCRQASTGHLARLWSAVRDCHATHFAPHFAIEEEHLLPALVALGEKGWARRIEEDHSALRAAIAKERPGLAEVHAFGERLEAHVRFEEREVFEHGQARLPEEALAAIERACAAVPRSCPMELVDPKLWSEPAAKP